jgi:hypothetical protein
MSCFGLGETVIKQQLVVFLASNGEKSIYPKIEIALLKFRAVKFDLALCNLL